MAASFVRVHPARADDSPPVEVHAFVSQGFIKTTDNNYLADSKRGSFEFTEVGLNFTKTLSDQMRVGMQLFTRDLGPIGNYTPQFDWFYLDYRFWDWLGVRAGRTKLPFGLYNETNDIDAARVPILLPQSVYPVTSRDYLLAQTGFELYGRIPFEGAGALEYRVYGGTIYIDTTPAQIATIPKLGVPYVAGGRVMWQLPFGLQAGASVQALRLDFDYQPPAALVSSLQMAGQLPADFRGPMRVEAPVLLGVGSIEYQLDDWLIAAEYSRWRTKLESPVQIIVPSSDTVSERGYVMTSYRVLPWFTPGAYYSMLYKDVDHRSGRDAYQHDVAATLRFDLNDHWLLKVEGHYMNGTGALSTGLNDGKALNTLPKEWGLLLLKTTAYF
ncbi:MAG: hypothetical protein ABW133_23580 [Polyangiaceae bacterium]